MLRDLLTQKFLQKKRLLILDTPEHVDSEKLNRETDLGPPRPPGPPAPRPPLPTFSKRDLNS
jgi:hypothetical protein